MTFIQWGNTGSLWHVERSDGFAVCGYQSSTVEPARTRERPAHVCRSCERMKDSDTMQLRKDPT